MTVFMLHRVRPVFPDPRLADPEGLLALGGGLSPAWLLAAYARGIFPWYDDKTPILWWSPDPRLVLEPERLHVPRSLRRVINSRRFSISVDHDFDAVIDACAATPRPDQPGTWLVPDMVAAYKDLHREGHAHSVEARDEDGELAGGLYGVALGRVFFGESMFFSRSNASKVVLVWAVRLLQSWGYELIDCQQTTEHMVRFGACDIPRAEFLVRLSRALESGPTPGAWTMDDGFWPL